MSAMATDPSFARSPWHLADYDELCGATRNVWSSEVDDQVLRLVTTPRGLWLICDWRSGATVAFRVAFSPGELTLEQVDAGDDGIVTRCATTLGVQQSRVQVADDGVVSFRTVLRPRTSITIPSWPRDIVPLGSARRSPNGTVHTQQRGLRTGLLHASLTGRRAGSFMYLQDLTALQLFCDATHASAADTVGGDWPDIGFRLPVGTESLDRSVGRVALTRVHLAFADGVPEDPAAVAEQYLELLARLYFHIERPTPDYVNWIDYAARTRADLERCSDCWSSVGRAKHLRAYLGDSTHPPESMVSLAVLVPLVEREHWTGEPDPLTNVLRRRLPAFFDERVGSIARWLPEAEDILEGDEPHEGPRIMDSWYLFHPLLNLGRLAAHGDQQARQLFLSSLPRAIKTAHRFQYRWPVFYDVDTLTVIRAETQPGAGGEHDVPGLYAHVMLQAWELTDDRLYLHEAIAAGKSLTGKGFELTYQMNNVAFGMTAMLHLHQITGDGDFIDVAHVLAACLLDNCGIWQCLYGNAAQRASFMGVFPLSDAPYTAAYEEAEVAATCLAYLTRAGKDVSPALAVLLPELIRHATARLPTYYPINIPTEVLAAEPKTGRLDRSIYLPVEDLSDGWAKAGTVGQEIYGAGMAFSTMIRSYVPMREQGALIYCDYPFEVVQHDDHRLHLRIIGDLRLDCRVRVLPAPPRRRVPRHVAAGTESGPLAPSEGGRFADYVVPAGQELFVDFGR
jgi:hypothetical protein